MGSQYFAEHPAIPLRQLVYNLNVDNASYNDTTVVTVVALERTSAEEDIKRACTAYGLSAISEAVLKANLFEGSDNFNFARKGVPAPTFSLGMRKFDESIRSRYHQLSDEVGNLNLNYTLKFIKAYVLAAKYIADNKIQPTWTKGDKYENTWKSLYRP
ncbi:MAG: M28 family peptidase [Bacteroidota bacterium]